MDVAGDWDLFSSPDKAKLRHVNPVQQANKLAGNYLERGSRGAKKKEVPRESCEWV